MNKHYVLEFGNEDKSISRIYDISKDTHTVKQVEELLLKNTDKYYEFIQDEKIIKIIDFAFKSELINNHHETDLKKEIKEPVERAIRELNDLLQDIENVEVTP